MSEKEVSAGIHIYREDNSWTWKIVLRAGLSLRQDHRVHTDWVYQSVASAKSAARRWCRLLKLGIEYIEVE